MHVIRDAPGVIAHETMRFPAGGRVQSLTWPVGLVAVALGLLIAKFVTTCSPYYLIVGTGALVLGMVLIKNLQFGLWAYLFVAALAIGESPEIQSPNSGYRAGLMPSELLLGFLALLWLGRAVFTRGFRLAKSGLNLPLIALGVIALLSLVMNNIMRGTKALLFHQMLITQTAEVGLLWFTICAFLLAANTWVDKKWLSRLFIPVALFGLYFSVHRILGLQSLIPIAWGSFLLSAAIAFVYSRLLLDNLDRTRKIGFTLLLLIMLAAAYMSLSWVSGWVAVTGAILVVSYYRSRTLAGLLVVLALVAIFVYPGVYHPVREESERGGDFDRFVIWHDAFDMFMSVSPVLGVGPGNYHPYVYFHNTLWFGTRTYTTAHSNYVQMAAELGLVGFAVFLWVIAAGIRAGQRAIRGSPRELKWLAVSATAIFASMVVASVMGDYLFPSRGNNGIVNFGTTVYTWLILGAAVAAANVPKEAEPTPTEQQ
jgi:O-antigen ligase